MRHLRNHMVGIALVAAVLAVAVSVLTYATTRARPDAAVTLHATLRDIGINLGGWANAAFPGLPLPEQQAVMAAVAASGIRWLRLDVPFATEEASPGRFTWTIDAEVRQAVDAGLRVDAVVDYPPAWARSRNGAPDPAAFAAFCSAAARNLDGLGVGTYEIGNEPNLARYWGAAVSPSGYAEVLDDAYDAIHRVEPAAVVLAGGLAQSASSGPTAMAPLLFLQEAYAAGIHGHFDALADHPYTFPKGPDPGDAANAFGVLLDLRQVMTDHGDGAKQIWLTEYGAPTAGSGAVTPDQQAAMVAGVVDFAAARPWVGPVMLFDWQDDAADGAFGLRTSDGTPKPSYGIVTRAAAGVSG